jgi:hypothetical protein
MWTAWRAPRGLVEMAQMASEEQSAYVAAWSCPCGGLGGTRHSSKHSVLALADMVEAVCGGAGNTVALRDEIDALVAQITAAARWMEEEALSLPPAWRSTYERGARGYRRARAGLAVMRCFFEAGGGVQFLTDGLALFDQAMADVEELEADRAA